MAAVVNAVLLENKARFEELRRLTLPSKRVPGRAAKVLSCRLCGVKKHTCRWSYRMPDPNKREAVGGICYPCVRAAKLLRCSRSVELISTVGLKPALQTVSAALRESLVEDVCSCYQCQAR